LKLPKSANQVITQVEDTGLDLEDSLKAAEGEKKSFIKKMDEFNICDACGVHSPTDQCKSAQIGYDKNGGYVAIVYGKKSFSESHDQLYACVTEKLKGCGSSVRTKPLITISKKVNTPMKLKLALVMQKKAPIKHKVT